MRVFPFLGIKFAVVQLIMMVAGMGKREFQLFHTGKRLPPFTLHIPALRHHIHHRTFRTVVVFMTVGIVMAVFRIALMAQSAVSVGIAQITLVHQMRISIQITALSRMVAERKNMHRQRIQHMVVSRQAVFVAADTIRHAQVPFLAYPRQA